MAPTIIVAQGEDTGEVARKLLALADHQNQVSMRTDLDRPAFVVPDHVYDRFTGKGGKRDDAERRLNQQEPGTPVPDGDELPESAVNVEPGTGDVDSTIVGDDMPAAAVNAEPPANGDDGSQDTTDGEGDSGEQQEDKPKTPRKRAPRAAKKAAASAAGTSE